MEMTLTLQFLDLTSMDKYKQLLLFFPLSHCCTCKIGFAEDLAHVSELLLCMYKYAVGFHDFCCLHCT